MRNFLATGLSRLLLWSAACVVVALALAVAATSPLLASRDNIYIIAGIAGVVAMGLLLFQPLLMGVQPPGLRQLQAKRLHRWLGFALTSTVLLHVVGLWIFSPPDVIDALLLRSPTAFSLWGVIAMWAVLLSSALVTCQRRLRFSVRYWRIAHTALAAVIVLSTVVHTWLIEGTMGVVSKVVLCTSVLAATVWVVYRSFFPSIQRK